MNKNKKNILNVKGDFPILNNNKLVYLDSSATSLKPRSVINAVNSYNSKYSANVHRGIYEMSEKATLEYEKARKLIADFINAKEDEVVFVRNATEAINLIAYVWGEEKIRKGDNILTSIMEHHSNFIPWQELAKRKKAKFKVVDIKNGELDLKDFKKKFNSKTKLVAITHVSNVLGIINPIKKIIRLAHKKKALVLVDGAQAIPHLKVDIKDLDCDFYAFSGHKMLGPTGIGALWAKKEILNGMKPFLFGGSMIEKVTLETSTFNHAPEKFEAGTPDISGAIGLGEAVKYLSKIGMDKVELYEQEIRNYAYAKLSKIQGLTIYGPKNINKKCGVFAFNIKGIHPHDLATILDEEKVAVRAGHHCAMPLHTRLHQIASIRASFYIYNDKDDVDKLVKALKKAIKVFKNESL
ncbi:MAG TPA: cysteine desulfurase [Patescibacteria group bacterium]|nr:cysteine desulfurase [Patescibacteria group bacterium]